MKVYRTNKEKFLRRVLPRLTYHYIGYCFGGLTMTNTLSRVKDFHVDFLKHTRVGKRALDNHRGN